MPRRMELLKINEISGVDYPAQEHAVVKIIKRKIVGTEDIRKAALTQTAEAIVKYWPTTEDGAMTFTQLLDLNDKEKVANKIMEDVWPILRALEDALRSIVGDRDLSSDTKLTLMRSSVDDFLNTVSAQWPTVSADMQAVVTKGAFAMATKIEAFEANLTALQKRLDAVAKGSSADPDIAKALKEIREEVTKVASERDAAIAKAEASDDEKDKAAEDNLDDEDKEHAKDLDKAARREFIHKSRADRKALIAKAKAGDETVTIAGTVISKRAVGDATFAVLKAQDAQIAKQAEEVRKERDLRETAEFTKRATDELAHLPGEMVSKVAVLKAITTLPEDVQKALGEMLKAGDGSAATAFNMSGVNDGKGGSIGKADAIKRFNGHVDEIRKSNPKLSMTDAMVKARQDYPDDHKAAYGLGQ